jgi:ATP-dependent helicase/nuclease subunit B
MLHQSMHQPLTIAPGQTFWTNLARRLLDKMPDLLPHWRNDTTQIDLSGVRVVVPAFAHAHYLRMALHAALAQDGSTCAFIPPRICTLHGWLALQMPTACSSEQKLRHGNERLITLYGELRQHAWLKKLFAARRNIDLLPLAQTLLTLTDELSAALLPIMAKFPEHAEARWQAALAALPATARALLSDESQLVWAIWKTQLDASDPTTQHLNALMQTAQCATTPLVWIAPAAADPCTAAFLEAWSEKYPVLPIVLNWNQNAVKPLFCSAWPEILEPVAQSDTHSVAADLYDDVAGRISQSDVQADSQADFPSDFQEHSQHIAVYAAVSLEDEATNGAQTIVDWIQEGKTEIAIVAQDRVVARRIRALLQRAEIQVADETGWKLSTTRAAAALAAWFDVVTSRAESTALLDFLKSPFVIDANHHSDRVMVIEHTLRRANIAGGWRSVIAAVPAGSIRDYLQQLAQLAESFKNRHSIADWLNLTATALTVCGIKASYATDAAGLQVLAMLEEIGHDCAALTHTFSFSEWRACINLHMEATAFMPPIQDRRVVMLPLNGTHLRSFDAVLVVGADATHLPSALNETLFFANAVRRELGLVTRENRQLQQLRNFVELLSFNSTVVVSWQAFRNGEHNPVSHWIARLELALAHSRQTPLPLHRATLSTVHLTQALPLMPAPSAPMLIPEKLSASGYAYLVACPYQFFAMRMLSLSVLDEFSKQLGKRDYGDWLHQILHRYHVGIRDQAISLAQRAEFLEAVTNQVFERELSKSAAALGYYDRWQKAMPAYLEWANAHEAQGWQFVNAEQPLERTLPLPTGQITLHGRIDRIDCNHAGDTHVLDYKTSNKTNLKKRIDSREDYQLAFYGLLSESVPQSASYVVLEQSSKGKIESLTTDDYAVWRNQLATQIGEVLDAIAGGAGLRATGIETNCRYCEVRGLCRKGAW